MGVSLKKENEEHAGKTVQISDGEGGRRGSTGTSMEGLDGKFLVSPPACKPYGPEGPPPASPMA
jgi:hypothetical protein